MIDFDRFNGTIWILLSLWMSCIPFIFVCSGWAPDCFYVVSLSSHHYHIWIYSFNRLRWRKRIGVHIGALGDFLTVQFLFMTFLVIFFLLVSKFHFFPSLSSFSSQPPLSRTSCRNLHCVWKRHCWTNLSSLPKNAVADSDNTRGRTEEMGRAISFSGYSWVSEGRGHHFIEHCIALHSHHDPKCAWTPITSRKFHMFDIACFYYTFMFAVYLSTIFFFFPCPYLFVRHSSYI